MKTIKRQSSKPRLMLLFAIILMFIITFITSSFLTKTENKVISRTSIIIEYKDGKKFYILVDDMNNPISFIKAN